MSSSTSNFKTPFMTPSFNNGNSTSRKKNNSNDILSSSAFSNKSLIGGITPIPGDRSSSVFLDATKDTVSPFGDEYFGVRDHRKRQRRSFCSNREEDAASQQVYKQQVTYLKLKLEEQELTANAREQELLRRLKTEEIRSEEKVNMVRRLKQELEESEDEKQEMNRKHLLERRKLTDGLEKLDRKLRKLTSDSLEEQQLAEDQIRELQNNIKDHQKRADRLDELVERLQRDLKEARASSNSIELKRVSGENTLLQSRIALLESKNRDLELEIRALEGGAAVSSRSRELHEGLRLAEERERTTKVALSDCKQQLSSLYEYKQDVEVLRAQLDRVTTQRDKLIKVEMERDALKEEKFEWEKLFKRFLSNSTATTTTGNVQLTPVFALGLMLDLQNNYSLLQKQKGDLEVKLTQSKEELSRCRQSSFEIEQKYANKEQELAQCEEKLSSLDSKCDFLSEERSGLLRVMETVKDEAYATLPQAKQDEDVVVKLKANYDNQIKELKERLESSHARVSVLERELAGQQKLGASPALLRTKTAQLQSNVKRIEVLQKEKEGLEKKLEQALDKVAEMEHHVASGMYNPMKTKVLHLTHNPETLALGGSRNDELKSLREENACLKKELASSGASSSMSDPNKRSERLKQMFKEKTKAFKEAVYLLTGYKIDMMEKERIPQLRLRSMFAEQPDDELVFQWTDAGLELLETEFCKQLDDNTFAYLTKCNSVPAFLSTLTLDLFGKQTLAIG